MLNIPSDFLVQISKQAEAEYPQECCGILLGPQREPGEISRLRPCANAQNRFHAEEPAHFPRTAQTAYFINPSDLFEIQKEARRLSEEIRVIYHSHIDAEAIFSKEDERMAVFSGEPAYPNVHYLILSVRSGKVAGQKSFTWDPAKKMFH